MAASMLTPSSVPAAGGMLSPVEARSGVLAAGLTPLPHLVPGVKRLLQSSASVRECLEASQYLLSMSVRATEMPNAELLPQLKQLAAVLQSPLL